VTVNDRGTADQYFFYNSTSHTVTYNIVGGQLYRIDSVEHRYFGGSNYTSFQNFINFSGISHLTVYGGKCINNYDVLTDALSTPVSIYGGPNDMLAFNDSSNADDMSDYTVTTNRVTRVGLDFAGQDGGENATYTAMVDYYYIPDVFVTGGTSPYENFFVQGVAGGTHMTIIGGLGQNAFYIGDAANSLDAIAGDLHIYGQGTDSLVFNDTALQPLDGFTDTVAFTLTAYTLERTHTSTYTDAFGPLSFTNTEEIAFTGVQSLVVDGGSTATSFAVESTLAGGLSIDCGAGDNTITIGGAGNGLEELSGPIQIFGGAGTNHLVIDDRLALADGFSLANSAFTINAQSVSHTVDLTYTDRNGNVITRTATAEVSYDSVADVALYGGSTDNIFLVQALPVAATTLDGGSGVNTLDYSGYTGGVTVNLQLGQATGFVALANIRNVTGSNGNDILVGDGNDNILIGGTGRNLIIGGGGADQLIGGNDDNILIAGTTAYDLNPDALQAIMQEWTRTDLTFDERVAELSGSDFADPLTVDTVFADPNGVVVSGPAQNWLPAS
jgi:hypothetical protein